MITFTFKGHKISIRNDDWQKLKDRFNPDNAKKKDDGDYVIDIPCSLCERHRFGPNCGRCPLSKIIEEGDFGCTNLMNSVLRKKVFRLSFNDIDWDRKKNSRARRQLRAILHRMDKIEQNQEGK